MNNEKRTGKRRRSFAPASVKGQNICNPADYEELRRHYRFAPDADEEPPPSSSSSGGRGPRQGGSARRPSSTWQERMTSTYEAHLYREYVLADLSRVPAIGLRWRTKTEVLNGRGFHTCGNKKCPAYERRGCDIDATRRDVASEEASGALRRYCESLGEKDASDGDEEEREVGRLSGVVHGIGLSDYEVPFSYVERGESKTELVKLKLCLRCAPLLFTSRGGAVGALRARDCNSDRRDTTRQEQEAKMSKNDEESESSSSSSSSCHRRKRERERKKRRKDKSKKKSRKGGERSTRI